jgi:DNA-cytosine methyltransferase
MNVLSLFDGMSGGQLALQKAGLQVDKYYSCEIDEYAQSVTRYNFPDTIFLGDVTKVDFSKLKDIDLVIGGSPCQDLSFAKGNGKGLEGSRSSLFYKFVEAIEVCKPEYFFLENVKMKQEWKDIISDLLGVQPIFINSADFSAQQRQRLYWSNIPVYAWTPCQTKLQDILETGQVDRDKSHCLDANYFKGGNLKSYFEKHRRQLVFINPASIVSRRIDKLGKRQDYNAAIPKMQTLEVHEKTKSRCVSTVSKDSLLSPLPEGRYEANPLYYRKLTPIECERLQTVPDNYTSKGIRDGKEVKISNTQRYKMLGNGWTINVIAHIFESLRKGAV